MQNNYGYYIFNDNDRQFIVPFLLGGLGGAAVVGLSRPRPVYVNQPYNQGYYPNQYYRPPYPNYGGYGYSNYNYYY